MKKKILSTIYKIGGFKPFRFASGGDVLILMYHRFSEHADPIKISRRQFDKQLRYLIENTNVISLDEMVECQKEGRSLPPNPVVLTIDDGYSDAYEIAFPVLAKYRLPATVYAVIEFLNGKIWLWTDLMRYALLNCKKETLKVSADGFSLSETLRGTNQRIRIAGRINSYLKGLPDEERIYGLAGFAEQIGVEIPDKPTSEYLPMSWDEARELDRNNIRIESHTMNHPILTKVSRKRLAFELNESKSALESELGRPSLHFCYPDGGYDETVRQAVSKAGYHSAVTTDYGFSPPGTDLFRVKRVDAQPGIANFAQSVSGFENIREKIGI